MKRILSLTLAVIMILLALGGIAASAYSLTVESIPDAKPGETVKIGGICSLSQVQMRVYAPGEDVPFYDEVMKTEPNHTYFKDVKLPDGVLGEFTVIAGDDVTGTFMVTETGSDKNSSNTSDNNNNDKTSTESPAKSGNAELYIDGRKQEYAVSYEKGELTAPLHEFLESMHIKYTISNDELVAYKNEYIITITLGTDKAVRNLNTINDTFTFKTKTTEESIGVLGVIGMLGMGYTYDEKSKTAVISTMDRKEWWFKYPTMAETGDVDATDARIDRGGYASEMTWGILAQLKSWADEGSRASLRKMEDKYIAGYFGAGGGGGWLITYDKEPSAIDSLFRYNAWGANSDILASAAYIAYTGVHGEVNDEPIVTGIGLTRESLGYSEPLYPNGESAVGYIEESALPWPMNAKIYDMAVSKGVDGRLSMEASHEFTGTGTYPNLMTMTVGSEELPRKEGYSEGDVYAFMGFMYSKDLSAPFWKEHSAVAAREMAKFGSNGAWHDNMSPWFNFNNPSVSYGYWSEYTYNVWMAETYSEDQLKAMGISDINTFNIREYVYEKTQEIGDASELWLDDPVWSAYKVHKKNTGSSYLDEMYKSFKEAYAIAEIESGYCVMGNDMPSVNHGYMEDYWMDQNSSEINTDWNLTFGSRGIMTPPDGKLAVFYKTAIETANSPYMTPWVYANEKTKSKTNLGKIYLAEAFANAAFIKFDTSKTVGTAGSHRWMNKFLYTMEETFGKRYGVYDVAILQSPVEQAGNMAPNGLMGANNDYQFHMQSNWGFSHAFEDAHVPYRVIPMWKLTKQILSGVKTLVVPNTECLDDYVLPILQSFVENGGRLVMTGPVGIRYGFDGLMQRREEPLLNGLIGKDVSDAPGMTNYYDVSNDNAIYTNAVGAGMVVWTANPVGYDYYMEEYDREVMLPAILEMVGATKTLFDGSNLPLTVGSNVWTSADTTSIFVDLVNYDIYLEEDEVTSAAPLSVKVKLGDRMDAATLKAQLIGPDVEGYITDTEVVVEDGWATVNVPSFDFLVSVKLSSGNAIETKPYEETPSDSAITENAQAEAGESSMSLMLIIIISGAAAAVVIAAVAVVIVVLVVKKKR